MKEVFHTRANQHTKVPIECVQTAYGCGCNCTLNSMNVYTCNAHIDIYITFSHLADAYPKRLTMYTHFTFTLMAHQEQLGVQCLAQGRFDRESN